MVSYLCGLFITLESLRHITKKDLYTVLKLLFFYRPTPVSGMAVATLFFLLLSVIQPFCSAQAQPRPPLPDNNYQLELRGHYGFYLHHHKELKRFNAAFPSVELAFQKSTFGRQRWEALYSYPTIGFSFFYSGMGGFDEIGKAYAVYPFINFPLNRNVDSRLNFRLGVGLGYLTNKFDPLENFRNYAIGSHLNAAASLFFDYRKTISPRFTFIAAAGLTHFSNGSTKTPNYGLNIVSAVAGINMYLSPPNPYLSLKYLPVLRLFEYDHKRHFSVELMQSFGTIDMSQKLGKRYYVSNTAFRFMIPHSLKGKYGIGLELTYDGSDKDVLAYRNQLEGKTDTIPSFKFLKPGISIAYEMMLSKTSFLFDLGFHLGGAEKTDGIAYQKAGLKYHFNERFFGVISLTAHAGRADFIGYGVGYRWDRIFYRHRDNHKLKL